ncbi:hypothetical protein ACP4OV_012369 [Aristida adscensionis]
MEMTNLARRLLSFMAADLGVSQEALLGAFFDENTGGKRQIIAFHHYPPCCHPEKVLGTSPHTDDLSLTLLLHTDDTPILQIKRDCRWLPVPPLLGALVINVLTSGAYKGVETQGAPECRERPNQYRGVPGAISD